MIKKQRTLIIIAAAVFLALLAVYFIFFFNKTEDVKSEPQVMMFDEVPRDNIQRIEVNNDFGSYAFYYNTEQKEFFVEGNNNAPYSKEMFSYLVNATAFPLAMKLVTENCENFGEYGLAENDSPANYVLTTRSGENHKVWIGNKIPTGAGYYARNDGDNKIYIIESSIENTLLSSLNALITPILTLTVSQSDYYTIKNFTIAKSGKPFIQITSNTKSAVDSQGNKYEEFESYEMLYPSHYPVNSDNYDPILQKFQEFYGSEVLDICPTSEDFPAETLEKYGLKEPAYELFFEYKGIQNSIAFSPKNEDGSYYAYSLLFNIICRVDGELCGFLEWDKLDFIRKSVFEYNINEVESITVSSKDVNETFLLSIDEEHSTEKKTAINIKRQSNGESLPDLKDKDTGKTITGVENFRKLYMGLLSVGMVNYSDVQSTEGLDCLLKVKVVIRAGENKKQEKIEMAFYPYSSRRCLYTLNGDAEFYVIKDSVDKLINDTKRVIAGEQVDYQARQ